MPNAFRTATPMGDWRTLKAIASVLIVGVKDGEKNGVSYLYNVNDTIGVALESAAIGEAFVLAYHVEKVMVPKTVGVGEDFGLGERVWWNPVTRLVTVVKNNAYWLVGIATENAGENDAYVEIDLYGGHAILGADLT